MKRTEATAVYAVVMFALIAGAAQKWAVNSPRARALIVAHHHTMVMPQAPELAQLDIPAIDELQSAEGSHALATVERVQLKAYKAAKVCNRTEVRLAMQQARQAEREARLYQREMRHQWMTVTPAEVGVHMQPVQIEISNP